jgi:hypothetical protein
MFFSCPSGFFKSVSTKYNFHSSFFNRDIQFNSDKYYKVAHILLSEDFEIAHCENHELICKLKN